jgi:hypothetical protein
MSNLKDKLEKLANNLVDPDGDILVAAEESGNDALMHVSAALVRASSMIKTVADIVGNTPTFMPTNRDLEELAVVASEFDASGDELLMKQASVLDQILHNFGRKEVVESLKVAQENELDRLRQERREQCSKECYEDPTEVLDERIKSADAAKAIEKSVKQYRPLETSLSTRYCPDHPGEMMAMVGDGTFQCQLDKKMYNWKEGFTTAKGNKVPGGDVTEQSKSMSDQVSEQSMSFSTRESATINRE